MIDRGKRGKILSEVKSAESVSKNLQIFWDESRAKGDFTETARSCIE